MGSREAKDMLDGVFHNERQALNHIMTSPWEIIKQIEKELIEGENARDFFFCPSQI